MSDGKFLAGLAVGIVAGVAAKFAYDNKEELLDIALDNYYTAKDELCTFAEYSKDKFEDISDQTAEQFGAAREFAQDQINDIKDMFKEAQEEVAEELDDDEMGLVLDEA